METINKKAIKRKRKLEGRMKCHGGTQNCLDAHINPGAVAQRMMRYMAILFASNKKKETPQNKRQYEGAADFFKQKPPEKPSFFRRLFKRQA